jgi:hypothetical protein
LSEIQGEIHWGLKTWFSTAFGVIVISHGPRYMYEIHRQRSLYPTIHPTFVSGFFRQETREIDPRKLVAFTDDCAPTVFSHAPPADRLPSNGAPLAADGSTLCE